MTALAVANIATIVAVLALAALAAQYVLREVAALRHARRDLATAWDAAVARAGGLLCESESGTPVYDAVAREVGL